MRKLNAAIAVMTIAGSLNTVLAQSSASPHVLVYKTKANYRKLVPVMLSEDKKTVVSYPDPADVKTGGGYPLPVLLHKGYLLDKRGVGKNTAFIKLSYEEYGKLKAVPSPGELYGMMVKKNPLTELWDCGTRDEAKNDAKHINQLIDKKLLKKKCTAIK